MSLIKYQVPNGGFAVMEGEFGAGKSAFGKIFEKKLVLDDSIDCQIIQVHPLSTIQQIRAQLPKVPDKPLLVIIDDAHEASTLLLQKLTDPAENIYWLLLAEPGLSERVEAFSDRSVDLPLLTKEECFEFLQRQLQDQPKYAQMSQMQSDTIWYSSQGLPKDIIEGAKKNFSTLFSGQESNENFDKANKSWYMTAALAAAAIIFLVIVVINLLTGDESEEQSTSNELVLEVDEEYGPEQKEESLLSDNTIQNTPEQAKGAEPEVTVTNDSAPPEMTLERDEKGKESSDLNDPIEDIALEVAKEPSPQKVTTGEKQTFKQWLSSQSQDAYSLQLFSHSDEIAARDFQTSVDLADSYVYSTELKGEKRYRVLWGAFPTRAEAQQAIESLPPEILAQKPWIRQLSSVVNELAGSGKDGQ
ncbi:SPOR domain-containing protein [Kangiella sediminilitoris]|nr:SPOR domain-containing protein [Kangiella sediminilitoris]